MVWDKLLPAGGVSISQGDDAIRENNDKLEAAIDLEHKFTTGGPQDGRHTFLLATEGMQNGFSVLAADDGWVLLRDDVRDNACWYYYDSTHASGGGWYPMDVGTGDIPRIDEQSLYTVTQWSEWQEITVGGATVAIDFALAASQWATVPAGGPLAIGVPSNLVGGHTSSMVLELVNAAGGASLTWPPVNYRFPYDVAPAYDDAALKVNTYYLSVMRTGTVLVTAAPSVTA
jgi:hypothetical protein